MRKKRKLSLTESLAKIKQNSTDKQPSINAEIEDDGNDDNKYHRQQ